MAVTCLTDKGLKTLALKYAVRNNVIFFVRLWNQCILLTRNDFHLIETSFHKIMMQVKVVLGKPVSKTNVSSRPYVSFMGRQALTYCLLVDSSTVICWASPFVILGVSGLFCGFDSIFDRKSCKQTM